jgi:Protein of unknown function (DUF3632)
VARLTSAGLTNHASYITIWELRHALEDESAAKEIANCNVSVASEWIIRNGMQLYSKALNPEPLDEYEKRVTMGGSLYNGEVGLCRERWQFWKLRFSEVKDEVDEEVAKMAQQAINAMETIEKAMG